jgi:transcriptional regulator with XRE-family HTH domain
VTTVRKRPEVAALAEAINSAFGARLRQLRRSQEVSQLELASRVGISRVTVATIEGGKQNTQLHHVFLFARALDVPVEKLVPSLEEVERERRLVDEPSGGRAVTSGELFLRDARAQLLQLRKGSYDQAANKAGD